MKYKHLEQTLEEVGKVLREKYKERLLHSGISESGNLFNSIDYRLEVTEDATNLYFQGEDYYINIEEGRKPNSQMPPVEAIRQWMISRGLPPNPGIAFVIARSIGAKGIKPNPILRETRMDLKEYEIQFREALELDMQDLAIENIKGKLQINN